MKARSIIFIAFLIGTNVWAQSPAASYTFKVLVSKGKTEIKSGDAWENIKVGSSLKATDEVKLSENSYLGLIHANGKPLEVRDAKSFKVSELVSRLGTGTSVLNKYTDFILSSETDKRNRLSATGAVHRGVFKDGIIVYLSDVAHAELYGDKIGLQWDAGDVTGPYEVVFTDLMGDKLAKFETKDTQLTVQLNEGTLKDHYNVMVKVVSKTHPGQGSKDYVIKKLRSQDREQYTSSINEVKGSLEEGSALSKYIMAGYFEEKLLLNDALTAYQEAIMLAPDVALYKESYAAFLVRLGLKE